MKQLTAAMALTAAFATATATLAQPPDPKPRAAAAGNDCFYLPQLQANHALNDRTVILRVNNNDFYRLDFANRCTPLTYPTPKLILTPFGGSELVCHAIDLDIKVGDQGPGSIPEACIPSSLRKMTPAEVSAIPKKDLP